MPFFLKAYKITNHLHDINRLLDLLYGFPGNIQMNSF